MSLYALYAGLLDQALETLVADGSLPDDLDCKNVAVEPPRESAHGDLATNAAMVLAKPAGTNPRALAGLIGPLIEAMPGVASVEVAVLASRGGSTATFVRSSPTGSAPSASSAASAWSSICE